MARTSYGGTTHAYTATGSNDPTKQVSVNRWNELHSKSEAGMLGFTKQSATISGNAIAVTGTLIEIQADGTLNTITPTDANEFDLIYLIAKSTATSVTITHDAGGGAGKIRLLSGANETLSTTSPMILMCRTIGSNKEWNQYGGGIVNALNDIGDVNITSVANDDVLAYDSTTSKWINQSASETGRVTADSTTTFTNKSIDLTDNTLTGTSAELRTAIADETGTGALVFAESPTLVTPALGTPASGTLTNCTFPTLNQNTTGSSGSCTGNSATATSATTAGVATKVTITDNESTNEDNAIIFTAGGAVTGGNLDLESDGTCTYNPSTGKITATGFVGALTGDVTGNVSGSSGSCTGLSATSTALATGRTIGMTGDVVWTSASFDGTGNVTGTATIQTDAVDIAMLSATGTASSTTFLRGDNTWATAGGGAENTIDTKLRDENDSDPSYTSRTENDASTPIQIWSKTLDSNNENLYVRVKKNGSYTNVQIA